MNADKRYTAFQEFTRVAGGNLETVLQAIWNIAGEDVQLLIFEDDTGRPVDFDLRGSMEEVLARYQPPPRTKGPGRPRLGVVSREISLLPRHWEWLERQPQKASGTLRRLVEAARKNDSGETRLREKIKAADRFLWSIAGNLEGAEEVSRALYTGDWSMFDKLISPWPPDIRNHMSMMVRPVREAEAANKG